MPNSNTLY